MASLPALGGLGLAKRSALLLAIEPGLRGLLAYGPRGCGKSALLSALQPLVHATVTHHWELLSASERRASLAAGVVLAASDQPSTDEDHFGLIAYLPAQTPTEERLEVLESAEDDVEAELLRREVVAARERLPAVSGEPARALAETAAALGVEGNRADYFAWLAARANAALEGRTVVEHEDLEVAVQTVLAPRARAAASGPPPVPGSGAEELGDSRQAGTPGPLPEGHGTAQSPDEHQTAAGQAERGPGQPEEAGMESSLAGPARPEVSPAESAGLEVSRPGPPHSQAAKASDGTTLELLLAAAAAAIPELPVGRKRPAKPNGQRGRMMRAAPASGRQGQIALAATIRAALPWQRLRGQSPGDRLKVSGEDLRLKRFARPRPVLHLVVLDASGSMASNRMAEAKGSLRLLLRRLYVRRDRVALIAFRQQSAVLLLPPTRSLSLARRAVDQLSVGGGTPLAAGIELALGVAARARMQAPDELVRLLLLTDGHAQVELEVARRLRAAALETVLVDTSLRFLGLNQAQALAGELGAHYTRLQAARCI